MTKEPKTHLSVNEYLDILNEGLKSFTARVIGEVSDIQLYPDRSYLFFKIKDKENSAVLSCFMWKRDYLISGVELEVGLEVIASGTPGVFKPLGRLSLNTVAVELVGEGKLKKAYDELRAKLEKEGVFNTARKRELPSFPQKIGLITSKDGAAIGDFQVNLGGFGFKIVFIDSRVEGQLAVSELLSAIQTLKSKNIEVLVLIRGGGSLESLLPFNNEVLVREVVDFPVPVLVGVGHEKDVSLIGLAADKMVSTPTAAAQILNESWQRAVSQIELNQNRILSVFGKCLTAQQASMRQSFQKISSQLQSIFNNFNQTQQSLLRAITFFRSRMAEIQRRLIGHPGMLIRGMRSLMHRTSTHISGIEKNLEVNDPERQLKLGYSIVRSQGSVIRSIKDVKRGQSVETHVRDGFFQSDVTGIGKGV